jgi:phosphate transport system permease protein
MSAGTVSQPLAPPRPEPSGQAHVWGDRFFHLASLLAALSVPLLTVLLVVLLVLQALPAIGRFGWQFLVNSTWYPDQSILGALPFIYGTVVTSALAMAIALPLGVGAAAYLSEVASGPVRRAATFLIELLAAIPSVVYGFWGLYFLVPIFQEVLPRFGVANTSGKGYFTAAVLLAIMIVPYITAVTFDVCRAVPTAQRQGALALGATRWQLIRSVVLPYARGGIIGAGFLALGRALGETMAVAMLIGNSTHLNLSIFDRGYTIPAVIANELQTPRTNLHASALVELGLVLFLVTVLVNSLARVMIWRVTRQKSSAARPPAEPENNRPLVPRPRTSIAANTPPRKGPLVSALCNRWAGPVNQFMTWVLGACLVLILVPLFHILGYIAVKGIGDLSLAFFTNLPNDKPPGLGNALAGSALMVALATLAAVPIGILAALYLTEYRVSPVAPVVRFVGELLVGVPSIILGVFAYVLLVMPFGFSAWAGAFALAVMMIPVVMRSAEESLKLVPSTLRNASYALGASHYQTVVHVIVPASLPAIITGVLLAIARIAGETAPLLFTAYNSQYWPTSPSERTPFLTYYIYNGALEDDPDLKRLAWAGALVLLAFVMAVNVGIRFLAGQRVVQASQAE